MQNKLNTRIVLVGVLLTLAAMACTCGPISEITSAVQEAQQAAAELQTAGPTLQAAFGTVQAEATNLVPTLNALASQGPTLQATIAAAQTEVAGFLTTINVCQLISGDDMAASAGQVPSTVQGENPCNFVFPDSSTITIAVINYQDEAVANGIRGSLGSYPDAIVLNGPFDAAIWEPTTASVIGIKGINGFTIVMSGYNGDRQAVGTSLANTLGSRLP